MKNDVIRIVRIVLFLIFFSMLIGSLLYILNASYSQKQDDALFEDLASKTHSNVAVSEDSENELNSSASPTLDSNSADKNVDNIIDNSSFEAGINQSDEDLSNVILSEYSSLYEENNQLYGWIRIDDTNIDFPVMYSPDNPQFYLYKNFYKEDSRSGTPFILTPSKTNTIIYGHNMKNNSVFSTLTDFKDIEFWQEHRYVEFDTLYEKSLYEIFIVSNTVVYEDDSLAPKNAYLFYQHTDLDTTNDFYDYINNLKKSECFDSGIDASFGDSLITLCTCDYVAENSRLLLVAKKIS